MEEGIKLIDIKTLQEYNRQNDCIDDYLFMTDRLENILTGATAVKMKVFLMIYCVKGEINLELNNKIYSLKTNDLSVSLPNTFIGKILASPDYQVRIICLSGRFIQRLTQTEKYTWKSFNYLHRNPIKHLGEKEKSLFCQYLNLIENKITRSKEPYQKDILLYLTSAFFTEFVAAVGKDTITPEEGIYKAVNQPDFIFKRFMEALTSDNGRHRTLTYYANLFNYSSKYLSRIIKQVSGKNALTLIHDNTIECIIHELKYSNKSIKEIAISFEFSNISFFAQYVKKHLGSTPSEYRNRHSYTANPTESEDFLNKNISKENQPKHNH